MTIWSGSPGSMMSWSARGTRPFAWAEAATRKADRAGKRAVATEGRREESRGMAMLSLQGRREHITGLCDREAPEDSRPPGSSRRGFGALGGQAGVKCLNPLLSWDSARLPTDE